jgi:hypothetical protein
MADGTQLQWNDEQWNKVGRSFTRRRRARVGNVLSLYGPLEPDAGTSQADARARLRLRASPWRIVTHCG